jgi:DNA-binding IclR family transcriptional regulator
MRKEVSRTETSVGTLNRGLDILGLFTRAGPELTQTEISEALGLPLPTVHRLTAVLAERGYLERDPRTRRFRLGLEVARFMPPLLSGLRLPEVARADVARLADDTGETVNLAVARRLELVYADQVQARHVMAPNWLGHTVPLHATSTGKAFLAALPEHELEHLAGLERFTDTTITDADALRDELAAVRERGFAVSHGELEPALWGVSAAALDASGRPAAVLSVWGVESRVRERLDALGALTAAAAGELEALLS